MARPCYVNATVFAYTGYWFMNILFNFFSWILE